MTTNPQYWALVLFGLVGCATVTSNGVRPDELARLDGYRGGPQAFGAEPEVQTLAGDKVTMRPDSYVFLDLPGAHVGGRFESIAVRDGVFDGRKLDGDRVQVRLDQITSARVDQPSRLPPLMITGGVLAAAVTLLLGMYLYSQSMPGIAGPSASVGGRWQRRWRRRMDGNGLAWALTCPRCRRRGGARWLPRGPRPRAPNTRRSPRSRGCR